jgi:hypothetical protein
MLQKAEKEAGQDGRQSVRQMCKHMNEALVSSSWKSICCASKEQEIPSTTVWWVLKIYLHIMPYRLQLLSAMNDNKVCFHLDSLKMISLCLVMNWPFIWSVTFIGTTVTSGPWKTWRVLSSSSKTPQRWTYSLLCRSGRFMDRSSFLSTQWPGYAGDLTVTTASTGNTAGQKISERYPLPRGHIWQFLETKTQNQMSRPNPCLQYLPTLPHYIFSSRCILY